MPRARGSGTGRTAKVAVVALVVIVGAAALLEMRSGTGSAEDLVEYARQDGADPLDLLEAASRTRRLLLIADVAAAAAPKRLAAAAIERLTATSGLDLVALEVDAVEQPFIDRYLATSPEDVSILLARPRAVREGSGTSREFLDIYRTVWRVNQELSAARRIRIAAIDAPGWPLERATGPAEASEQFGTRGEHMLTTVHARALEREPSARVLFFVDGLHALKQGGGRIQSGGARPVEIEWLAAGLSRLYPQNVYSLLVDAPTARAPTTAVAAYRGTALAEAMRRGGIAAGTALPLTGVADRVSRTPIRVTGTTGLDFQLEPRTARLSELADAYVYFGG